MFFYLLQYDIIIQSSRSGISLNVRGICRHTDLANGDNALSCDDAPSIFLGGIHARTFRNQDWSHSLPFEPIVFSPKPLKKQVSNLFLNMQDRGN